MFDSVLATQKRAVDTEIFKMFTAFECETLSYLFNISNMSKYTFIFNSRETKCFFVVVVIVVVVLVNLFSCFGKHYSLVMAKEYLVSLTILLSASLNKFGFWLLLKG